MYVRSVRMKNFRNYRDAEVSFVHPGAATSPPLPPGALPNVILLVGANGAGKTTVLKVVALSVLAPVIRESGYRPYYLVRRSGSRKSDPAAGRTGAKGRAEAKIHGSIEVHRQDVTGRPTVPALHTAKPMSRTVRNRDYKAIHPSVHLRDRDFPKLVYSDDSAAFFMVGYGATRRAEAPERVPTGDRSYGKRFQRVAGLFNDDVTLTPLGVWLPGLAHVARAERSAGPFREVCELLDATLPDTTRFARRFDGLDPLFRRNGIELPFGALSDGFRSYIGLVSDILYHLYTCRPKKARLTDMTGVVMIDDIDLHLHPNWQRVVVPNLATTFPKLQFVLTSHSPLVAGTLHAANVRVIGEDAVHLFTERLHGLSVDQILTSPYFGTPPRSPDAEAKLSRMAKRVADTGDPSAAVAFLAELAGKNP